MTVTHDFTLVESCEDPTTWTPTGDGAVSLNTTNYIEGAGALNIYKPNTTTTSFGAYHEFPTPLDLSNKKIIVVYIYVSEALRGVLRYVYLRVYDGGGNYYTVRRDENIAYNDWVPIYLQQYGTTIDWSNIVKIELLFQTWSSAQTVSEGDLVIDRILVGTGFWVLYTTDVNPHTMEDLAIVDARDKLGMIKRISKYAYYVMAPVYVGNGTDVGALSIDTVAVILDATQIGVWYYGVITVYANSFLITNKAILVHITRTSYPYGGAGITLLTNSIFRATNTYYISTSVLFYGSAFRHNFSTKEFTASGFYTNVMLWMYVPTVQNINWSGAFVLLPGASYVFDDYGARGKVIDTLLYLLAGSEVVPRNIGEMTFTNIVLAGGRIRVDAGAIAHVYNPVNFRIDEATSTILGTGTIHIYFDIDVYAVDRYGNPVTGTIEIYNNDGTLVFSGDTDEYGHVHAQLESYYYYYDGTTEVRKDYNPFTVVVKVGGGEIARNKILVYGRATFYITPDNVYTIGGYPGKTLIQLGEPIYLYAEVKKIDGSPVTGLEVYADITKPDLTIVTISFEEYEPGKYRGRFALTDQVGDYNARIYTTIENVTVETQTKFSVGVLEQKIDNLATMLATHDTDIKNQLKKHDSKLDAYRWTM